MNETPKIVTKDERVAALVGFIIFFTPCFMKTKTEYVTFYMNQSFGLALFELFFEKIIKYG